MPANNVTKVALSVAPEVIKMTVAENASYSNGYAAGYAAGEAAHAGDYQQGYDAGYAAGEEAHAGDYQDGYNAGYAAGEAAHEEDYQHGYQVGYTTGYAAGEEAHAADYQNGYDAGYAAGEKAHEEDYQDGYDSGYTDGYAAGEEAHAEDYQNGYDEGYADGAEVAAEELEKARQDGYDEGLADGEALHEEDYQNGYDNGYDDGYYAGYEAAVPGVIPIGGTPARMAVRPDYSNSMDVSALLSRYSDYIFQRFQGRITLDVSALGVPGYDNLALTVADEVIVREADPETGEQVMSEHSITFSAMRDSANYAYLTYGMHGLIDLVSCINGQETHFTEQQALQFPLKKPSWVMQYDNSQVGPEPAPTLLGELYVGDNSIAMPDTKARWMFMPKNSGIHNFKTYFDDFGMIRCVLRDVNGIAIYAETMYSENITFDYELSAATTYYLDLEITGASRYAGMITITLL